MNSPKFHRSKQSQCGGRGSLVQRHKAFFVTRSRISVKITQRRPSGVDIESRGIEENRWGLEVVEADRHAAIHEGLEKCQEAGGLVRRAETSVKMLEGWTGGHPECASKTEPVSR